jgi:hypothetical protein
MIPLTWTGHHDAAVEHLLGRDRTRPRRPAARSRPGSRRRSRGFQLVQRKSDSASSASRDRACCEL